MAVQDKTTSPIVLLLIPIATVMLIYGYLLFLSIKSIAKARGNPQTVSFGRAFYIMISLVPLSRIISFIIVSYEILMYEDIETKTVQTTNDIFGLMFLSLNYLPDLFLVLSFSIYGWLVLLVYLYGLIHLPHPHLASPNCKNALFIIWVIFLFCIELAQIVGFLNYLFNHEHFDFAAYVLLNGITSLAIAAFVIITEIVLHFVFSGIPFKAGFHQKRFALVNRILLYWGLASAGKGVLNILQKDQIEKVWRAIIEDITTPIDNIVPPLLLILQLFFVEIVPILLVNDSKVYSHLFVKTRRRDSANQALFQENSRQNLPENVESQAISSSEAEKNEDIFYYQIPQSRPSGPKERKTLGGNRAVDPKDVVLGQREEEERPDLLGVMYSANHKGEKLKARVIKLKKLTPYLSEEINREVLRFMQFNCPNLQKIRGAFCQDPEVTLYYEHAEQISLHDLLYKQHQDFPLLTFTLKIKVSILIAAALRYLHSQEPKVFHGHLKPSNILIDKEGNVKISDYGLFNLKKYANMMIGYTNVDQYTAPEIFSEKGTIVQPDSGAVDVYSFGVILWEIITEKIPFDGLSIPELYQLICKEASRPKIPAETMEGLQSIIRACWQQDPKKRPGFEEIIEILQDEVL